MADSALITRRLALVGAFASTVALAVPAAAAVHVAEEPNAKVRRLQRELSDALADLITAPVASGDYVSIVYPAGTVQYARTLMDRDVWDGTRAGETARSRAIGRWQLADDERSAAMTLPFDRTHWEACNFAAQDALSEMLRTFRTT